MQHSNKKIVVALGGNALGSTPYEQLELIKNTAEALADLVQDGYSLTITHGNGPQVGMINLAFDYSAVNGKIKSDMPFAECGAMSQGYIGYHLQNALYNVFKKRGIDKDVVSLVTQVEVAENDEAFHKPTKPVGMFYTKDQADTLAKEKGYIMVEDSGRGYRRVVASPKPLRIVEISSIKALVNCGTVCICSGGGGIPVVDKDGLKGVAAVIDKDFAAAKLAEELEADMLVILTSVDSVAINFGKENQQNISHMSIDQAQKYMEDGQFAAGSMLPKVKAAMQFAQSGGKAVIASLASAREALCGNSGTIIER